MPKYYIDKKYNIHIIKKGHEHVIKHVQLTEEEEKKRISLLVKAIQEQPQKDNSFC